LIEQPQLSKLLSSEATENCDTCSILVNTVHCLYSDTEHCIGSVGGWNPGESIFQTRVEEADEEEKVEIFVAEDNIAIPRTASRLDIRARRIPAVDTSSEDSLEWS
jgi:hypothetical protein